MPANEQPSVPDVWEARPPPQLILAVSLVAVLVTLNGLAIGRLVSSGERTPQTVGAVAIGLAAAQVAVATVFFTLGVLRSARKAVFLFAAIAYGGALVAAAAAKPIRWDAGCGELFILATIIAIPGIVLRLAGLRLVHKSATAEASGEKPWQFTLEGGFVVLTGIACFFAALRWIAASQASGIGVILEWLLLAGLPWIAVLLVALPIHPLASLAGTFVMIGFVTALSAIVGSFLNRPAMGLTAIVELVLAAAMLGALRYAGYELRLVKQELRA